MRPVDHRNRIRTPLEAFFSVNESGQGGPLEAGVADACPLRNSSKGDTLRESGNDCADLSEAVRIGLQGGGGLVNSNLATEMQTGEEMRNDVPGSK